MTMESIITGALVHLANIEPAYFFHNDMVNMTQVLTVYKDSICVLYPPYVDYPTHFWVTHATVSTKSMITDIVTSNKVMTFQILTAPPLPRMACLTYATNMEIWYPVWHPIWYNGFPS
jgi:hypothetical protein